MPNYDLKRFGPKNNYYVFWSEGTRSKRRSMRTDDKELAAERMKVFIGELAGPDEYDDGHRPLGPLLSKYLEDRRFKGKSLLVATDHIDDLKAYFKDASTADLDLAAQARHTKHLEDRGWSAGSINKQKGFLRAALRNAAKHYGLAKAPEIVMEPTPQGKERWLTRDEAKKLIDAAEGHVKLFVQIGLYTGARHEAILDLTWDRVDLETCRVDFNVPGRVKTKKRRPRAPIPDVLRDILIEAKKKATCDHLIEFRGRRVRVPMTKTFQRLTKRPGLKEVTPHTLKHTYITWALLRARVPVFQVSGLTATSVDTIVNVYGHHIPDDLRQYANLVAGE